MESPHCQKADGASLLSLQPFSEEFAERVLPFDGTAAVHYAEIVVARRRIGNPIEAFDAQIAATAPAVRASVATRDIGGFDGCGVTLIDPWHAT